jgi:hypothetical protein
MREVVTTILDVLGLLMIVTGLVVWLWPLIGPLSLATGGGVVWAWSLLVSRGGVEP